MNRRCSWTLRALMVLAGLVLSVQMSHAQRIADLDTVATMPRITVAELKALMARNEALVVDVRGDAAFRQAHIPGAISIPLDGLEAKVPDLKKETRTIVTYCT